MKAKDSVIQELGIKSVVNYLRRSRQDVEKERKTGIDTLNEQKLLMDRVLNDYGVPYTQEFEIGSGDKISTRPVFKKIVDQLQEGKYDAIAVKEISRLGRGSYTDMGIIYDIITEKRIFIISPWKIYDPTNNSDLRQIRFELFMSREEYETTRERLMGGRYTSALQGAWVSGAPPFGYDADPNTNKLIINEEEAKVVRTVFDFYANGIYTSDGKRKLVQLFALSTFLQRVGIKTMSGKDMWTSKSLYGLLTHERYIGVYKFNHYRSTSDGKRVKNPESEHITLENNHPAIIDMETWNKVQKRIKERGSTPKAKLDFTPNRLAGICVCKQCGRKMVRRHTNNKRKKKDGTISTYSSTSLVCERVGCTIVNYDRVEDDIIEVLNHLSDMDSNKFKKTVSELTIPEKNVDTFEDIKKQIESKKAELSRRMDFIYEKLETGVYSDEMFLERKNTIDKELEELSQINLNQYESKKTDEFDIEDKQFEIKSLADAYELSDNQIDKNNLLRSIFDCIEVELVKRNSGRKHNEYALHPYLKSSFFAR
ncbi:serine-type integrase SprA [Oceanobacillus oncorhynchi subsp. oncorhynchi]|uniref:recombinase family protein n=1 Tax=Oceanobacillus oncorhynchi TaxID=545501 RepID=UPI0031D1071F